MKIKKTTTDSSPLMGSSAGVEIKQKTIKYLNTSATSPSPRIGSSVTDASPGLPAGNNCGTCQPGVLTTGSGWHVPQLFPAGRPGLASVTELPMRGEGDVADVLRYFIVFCLISTPAEEPIRGEESVVVFLIFMIFDF